MTFTLEKARRHVEEIRPNGIHIVFDAYNDKIANFAHEYGLHVVLCHRQERAPRHERRLIEFVWNHAYKDNLILITNSPKEILAVRDQARSAQSSNSMHAEPGCHTALSKIDMKTRLSAGF